jgi:hypothetical protein
MPLAHSAVKMLTKPLPDIISPQTHFVIDYITAGAFFASAAMVWKVNKRAAIGATICGAAEVAVASLTTRPGGERRAISFRTHGRIDMGLAAMTAMMPEFMGLEDAPQSRLFLIQSVAMTAVAGLTDFDSEDAQHSLENRYEQRQIA